jgi:hypothetical protein
MRKIIYLPLVMAYLFEWLFTLLSNLSEIIAKSCEEIIVNLTNVINAGKSVKKKGQGG